MPSRAGSEALAGYPYGAEAQSLGTALSDACESILRDRAIGVSSSRGKVAVAFSGGLDSALLALLCSRHADVNLYVAGKSGCHDFLAAESAARLLALPLIKIEIDKDGLQTAAIKVASAIEKPAPIEIAVAIPLAYVCGAVKEKAIVTGTGADEIFGGYARYSRMPMCERLAAMLGDYERLKARGALTERSLSASYGKEVLQPYMGAAAQEATKEAPIEAHFWGGLPKSLLREAALSCGLPAELAMRPKKAAQYGSGVARMLSKAPRNPAPTPPSKKLMRKEY